MGTRYAATLEDDFVKQDDGSAGSIPLWNGNVHPAAHTWIKDSWKDWCGQECDSVRLYHVVLIQAWHFSHSKKAQMVCVARANVEFASWQQHTRNVSVVTGTKRRRSADN